MVYAKSHPTTHRSRHQKSHFRAQDNGGVDLQLSGFGFVWKKIPTEQTGNRLHLLFERKTGIGGWNEDNFHQRKVGLKLNRPVD